MIQGLIIVSLTAYQLYSIRLFVINFCLENTDNDDDDGMNDEAAKMYGIAVTAFL